MPAVLRTSELRRYLFFALSERSAFINGTWCTLPPFMHRSFPVERGHHERARNIYPDSAAFLSGQLMRANVVPDRTTRDGCVVFPFNVLSPIDQSRKLGTE